MKKIICSFASTQFAETLSRLSHQIAQMSFFDDTHLLDETRLDPTFRRRFDAALTIGSRGYGYWVWKPYIISQILDGLSAGDTLLYVDAGCHINREGKSRLITYYGLLEKSPCGVLAFRLPADLYSYGLLGRHVRVANYFLERRWTKGDLLDYFRVRDSLLITETPQIQSGVILIRKCEESSALVSKWLSVYYDHFHLVDDGPSSSPNLPGFIENRHDQSVFSLLCKMAHATLLSTDEVHDAPAIIHNHPILAIRDIGGRMPYKSFTLLRYTRMLKSPMLVLGRSVSSPSPKELIS